MGHQTMLAFLLAITMHTPRVYLS